MGLTHPPLWIKITTPTFIATMAKNNKAPLKKTNIGKSASKTPKKKRTVSAVVGSLVVESSPLFSTPLTVSSQSSTNLFFDTVAIVVVCCIEIVVCVVDDFEHEEKTRPRRGWQSCEYITEVPRTKIGGVRCWLVWFVSNQERMHQAHLNQVPPRHSRRATYLSPW